MYFDKLRSSYIITLLLVMGNFRKEPYLLRRHIPYVLSDLTIQLVFEHFQLLD